jgi:hypothetical protein
MSLWNNVRFRDRSLRLQKVGQLDTREGLHAAAKLRVEELLDGFTHSFTAGNRAISQLPLKSSMRFARDRHCRTQPPHRAAWVTIFSAA